MLDYGYGDAIERWEAERVDDDSEQAYRVFHGLEVLPVVGEHHETVTTSRPRISTAGPASDFGSEGAGSSGNHEERAA